MEGYDQCVSVVLQFNPLFKFYLPVFIIHCHTLPPPPPQQGKYIYMQGKCEPKHMQYNKLFTVLKRFTQKCAKELTSKVAEISSSVQSINFFPETMPALFTSRETSPTSSFTLDAVSWISVLSRRLHLYECTSPPAVLISFATASSPSWLTSHKTSLQPVESKQPSRVDLEWQWFCYLCILQFPNA